MHRFYSTELPTPDNEGNIAADTHLLSDQGPTVKLDARQTHHLRRVLRLQSGDAIELFDGKGNVAQAVIDSCQDQAIATVTSVSHMPQARPRLDLAVCLPKGPRAGEMVNQLSQLGVDRLIPLLTTRSVVDPRPNRLKRFQLAAIASASQCGRAYLMQVSAAARMTDLLAGDYDLKLMADPRAVPMVDLSARLARSDRVLVVVGPEGGWTTDECDAARQAGCLSWSFGAHVLRIEAAATAAAGIVRYLAATDGLNRPAQST
jgi:16S rRNA (uracil1498-N3)-methyltransferase